MHPAPAIFATLMILLTFPALAADRLTVFAAASLGDVMKRVGAAYTQEHGTELRFSFAASSTLARQIEAGAPADVIISANMAWMTYLADRSAIEADSQIILAGNRLALVGHRERFPEPMILVQAIDALKPGERIAIGDPAHVPAGIYARQALVALDLWDGLRKRLVHTADVRAALALVARGEAALALTYVTDAAVAANDVVVLQILPSDLHDAIEYPAAIVAHSTSPETRRFMEFLQGDKVSEILRDAGFGRGTQP